MPFTSPFGDIVPASEPIHKTFLRTIETVARADPKKKAFINGTNYADFVTYRQLYDSAHTVASYLHSIGFQKQIACTVLPNCSEFPIFALGVQIQGSGVSGASALFTDYELSRQLTDSQCTVVLTDVPHLQKVIVATAKLQAIKKIIVVGAGTNVSLPPKGIRWEDVVNTPINPRRPDVPVDLDKDIAILPYSSGTTGSPKGVMLTHRNFGTMLKIYQACMDRVRMVDSAMAWSLEHSLCFLPFYHVYGFGVLFYTISRGDTAIIMPHFDPHVFCKCIQDFKIQSLSIVPPILVMLAKSPIPAQYDLSSLVHVSTGAAPAGRDLCEAFRKRYPGVRFLQQGYGMTEVSLASHLPDTESHKKFGSVGKLAMGYKMKIVNVATGAECDVGESGEICLQSPTIMRGYLNRPEATAETIRDHWLHTGDIGYVDKDGDLFIVDRLKELIKVKGLQVPPAELEDLLLSHPGVHDVAVIGVPDADAGELPKAFVVPAHPKITAAEIASFVAAKMSPYKHLKGGVEFVKEIPKSASGKILRRILRDRLPTKM